MNNEWKELKIDNLPPDILTGDYEFEVKTNGTWCISMNNGISIEVLCVLTNYPESEYRYRKPEPKAYTHEEIMKPNRYWRGVDEDGFMVWEKADMYREDGKRYLIHDEWREKSHFSGRRFSDGFPPETTE